MCLDDYQSFCKHIPRSTGAGLLYLRFHCCLLTLIAPRRHGQAQHTGQAQGDFWHPAANSLTTHQLQLQRATDSKPALLPSTTVIPILWSTHQAQKVTQLLTEDVRFSPRLAAKHLLLTLSTQPTPGQWNRTTRLRARDALWTPTL